MRLKIETWPDDWELVGGGEKQARGRAPEPLKEKGARFGELGERQEKKGCWGLCDGREGRERG